jgi:hypothetical protein
VSEEISKLWLHANFADRPKAPGLRIVKAYLFLAVTEGLQCSGDLCTICAGHFSEALSFGGAKALGTVEYNSLLAILTVL